MAIEIGVTARWKWGNGHGEGRVVEKFTDDVERTLSGTQVKRNASTDEPAFLIEQDDGDQVLKSVSEVSSAE